MGDKKKIAIIGGGASGLICAYLLGEKYNITLYEKKSILGGNVQTLNKNVLDTSLPKHLNIENGVLGFSQNYYPCFHKLLDDLQVEYHSYRPSISLFSGAQFYPAKLKSYINRKSLAEFLFNKKYREDVLLLRKSKQEFKNEVEMTNQDSLSFDNFIFEQELYKKYLQSLFMLSFSSPFNLVHQLPQSILNNYFLSLPGSNWSFIKGGVYTYMAKMIQKTKMKVVYNAKQLQVSREKSHIILSIGGTNLVFDAVIIATTPGSVKTLLSDISTEENELFHNFEDQNFKTIAHKDLSFYKDYKSVHKTPMDLFYKYNSDNVGYNTYLNKVYKIKAKDDYSFAYNLEDVIDKKSILHHAHHTVPKYNLQHDSKMRILEDINGKNNTYFAGAYTDNGLHEGAVNSALRVSRLLGGSEF